MKYIINGFSSVPYPDELTVEFCIALKGKAVIPVVVSQSTESIFKISAKWNKKRNNKEGNNFQKHPPPFASGNRD